MSTCVEMCRDVPTHAYAWRMSKFMDSCGDMGVDVCVGHALHMWHAPSSKLSSRCRRPMVDAENENPRLIKDDENVDYE